MTRSKRGKPHVPVRRRDSKKAARARAKKKPPPPRVYRHPLYGDIPMIPATVELADGKTHSYWTFDPNFAPPMPRGAVRGDIARQAYCHSCDVPRYYYVDQARRCVQCGCDFAFGADEQKYWYESLKFPFDSVAIRCVSCRRRRRTDKALAAQLAEVLGALESAPEDPSLLVQLAETTVLLRERTGAGNLNRAIAAARAAAKRWPEHAPALFWEARCHELADRPARAAAMFERFVAAPGAKTHKALWRYATQAAG